MKEYYRWATYRRKLLDILQQKYSNIYHGYVLDIGGRDKGIFNKPKERVDKWVYADINPEYNPDIILDVTNMNQIVSNSVDVVNAIELFEHVEDIKKGLYECYRVLKKGGLLVISVPFLFPIHADPYDYQRWSDQKWNKELKEIGFVIEKFIIMGTYFTVLGDMVKDYIHSSKKWFKKIGPIFFPIIDKIVAKDQSHNLDEKKCMRNYHSGYFIIASKRRLIKKKLIKI